MLIGKFFKSVLPYYNDPIDSTLLHIYVVDYNLSRDIHYWEISFVKRKIMILKDSEKLIAMPIIHSTV